MELNKIAAAILLAGLIGMIVGKVSTILYYGAHEEHEAKRGYQIEGADELAASAGGGAAAEKELASIAPYLQSADATAGEQYFLKKCTTCHTIEQGGPNKTGPNLHGVIGRDIGSISGFGYSSTLEEAEGSWDYEKISHFLYKPKKAMPGTIMAFAGIEKDQERGNVIAYLRSQGSSDLPLPEAKAEDAATAGDEEVPVDKAEDPAAANASTDNKKSGADTPDAAADDKSEADGTPSGSDANANAKADDKAHPDTKATPADKETPTADTPATDAAGEGADDAAPDQPDEQ